MKIKTGDTVLVTAGKDRAKTGKVVKSYPKDERIVVEGMNIRKRHRRPRKSGEKGQVVALASPLPLSNVKLICPKCSKPTRVGLVRHGDKSFRTCKKCKAEF